MLEDDEEEDDLLKNSKQMSEKTKDINARLSLLLDDKKKNSLVLVDKAHESQVRESLKNDNFSFKKQNTSIPLQSNNKKKLLDDDDDEEVIKPKKQSNTKKNNLFDIEEEDPLSGMIKKETNNNKGSKRKPMFFEDEDEEIISAKVKEQRDKEKAIKLEEERKIKEEEERKKKEELERKKRIEDEQKRKKEEEKRKLLQEEENRRNEEENKKKVAFEPNTNNSNSNFNFRKDTRQSESSWSDANESREESVVPPSNFKDRLSMMQERFSNQMMMKPRDTVKTENNNRNSTDYRESNIDDAPTKITLNRESNVEDIQKGKAVVAKKKPKKKGFIFEDTSNNDSRISIAYNTPVETKVSISNFKNEVIKEKKEEEDEDISKDNKIVKDYDIKDNDIKDNDIKDKEILKTKPPTNKAKFDLLSEDEDIPKKKEALKPVTTTNNNKKKLAFDDSEDDFIPVKKNTNKPKDAPKKIKFSFDDSD